MAEDYKRILSPQAYGHLTKQSAESLKSMLKGKSFMQASMDAMRLLPQLQQVEYPYIPQLEELAVKAVKEAFPIIEEAGIDIRAHLTPESGGQAQEREKEQDLNLPDIKTISVGLGVDKRRLINGITQGASIRGTKAYYFFRDVLDEMDPNLIEKYNILLDNAYGIYDDDNAIAMMLAMLAQGEGNQGGESEADWDQEAGTMTITARAVVFPILVHEIIKGLYELISAHGFSRDAERNKRLALQVDKVGNEPEDIRYGKFIYDAINKLISQSKYSSLKKPSMREHFLLALYKLPDDEFVYFIDNLLSGDLTDEQNTWIENTLKEI